MAGAGALGLQTLLLKALRKVRYLAQRALRAILLGVWAVLLSPLTISSAVLLTFSRVELAAQLAERAAARNPFTPGLNRLLVKVYSQQGNLPRAASAAAAWARAHHRWDELTYAVWSQYLLSVPGWKPVVEVPMPTAVNSGLLDLTSLPALPLGRAAGSSYDELATTLVANLAQPPATVLANNNDPAAIAVAAAISDWCGAEVQLVSK